MANWNLSVDLRGNGANLARTLRQSATQARTLNTAVRAANTSIGRLGTSSRATGTTLSRMATQGRTASRSLRRLADEADRVEARLRRIDRDIQVRIDLDDRNLASRADAAAAALRAVRDAAQDTSRALRTLRGRAAATAAALDDLRDRAAAASRSLNSLNRRVATTNDRLGDMSTRTRTLRSDMDDLDGSVQRVAGHLGGLRGRIATLNQAANSSSGSMRKLWLAAAGLATALIPIGAALVPIAAGMAAAGAAAGAFGLAIGGQVASLIEAAEAHEKYEKAVREHGRGSAEAAKAENEYLHHIKEMPPATREAAAAMTVLKDTYGDWSDELAADTMPAVTHFLQLLTVSLPRATGLARTAGRELDHLTMVAGGAMQTPGFDRLIRQFEEFTASTLSKATTGIVDFATALDRGEIGADYREFMAYVRENGPLVADTLQNLAEVAVNVLVGFSDLGVSVLTAVNALAELVNAIPTGVVSTFVQMYAALKLLQLGMAGIAAIAGSGAAAAVATFFRSVAFGGLGAALGGIATRMTAVHRAALRLGVLAVAAVGVKELAEYARGAPPDVDRLTTSLKRLAESGRATGEFRTTFGDVDGLIDRMRLLQTEMQKLEDAQGGGTGVRIPILDDIAEAVSGALQDITKGGDSLNALEEDFKALDQALAGMAAGGHADAAAEAFGRLRDAAREQGVPVKELNALFPEYRDTVAALEAEQRLAAAGMGLFGQQALDTKAKLDAQKQSADGLRQAIQALNDSQRAGMGGMIAFEQAIDDAAKAAAENAGALEMNRGVLNLNSEKAREAATALQDLATKTDEAAAAARESGASWETVNGIYSRGRDQLVQTAQQMGLTEAQAVQLANSILKVPDKTSTQVEMRTEDAIAGLDAVIAKIRDTPGAKSVKVSALTQDAIAMLESLGYKVRRLPDGRFEVTAVTGPALSGIGAVQAARDGLRDKTITITTHYRVTGNTARTAGGQGAQLANAHGSITDYYAHGGITRQRGGVRRFATGAENHIAQIAPAGSWRVWAEPETGGEAYIPLAASKRSRSRAIAEETVRRLGGKGIAWNADGSMLSFAGGGFSYRPDGGGRDIADVQARYDDRHQPITREDYNKKIRARANALDRLREAEAKLRALRRKKHTRAQEATAERQVAAARRAYATATEAAATATARYKKRFSLADWQRELAASVRANAAWEADLAKVGQRGGAEVAQMLRGMGIEGAAMVDALAKASNKQFRDIVANLKRLAPTAKAVLADYTQQLNATNKTSAQFQADLAKLAAMGFGGLAAQLAAQGDEAAQTIAAGAVASKSAAAAANKAAEANAKLLADDELERLVAIIAAVKTNRTGIHDVAATTGLGEDEIIAVANKAKGQISSALGSRAAKFLVDLARANRGLAYANGGIREGIYATRGGVVSFAEPSTGGEAYIPLGAHKRGGALRVLNDVAGRFGVGLTDAAGSRVVVVREQGPLIKEQHWHVSGDGSRDLARDLEARNAYQLRRLARGGVGARS